MAISIYTPDGLLQQDGNVSIVTPSGVMQGETASEGPIPPGPSTPGGGGTGGFGSGGSPVPVWQPVAKDKTFHFIVTGTSTTIVEGSNDPRVATSDSANAVWVQLRDSVTQAPIQGTGNQGFENSFPWKYVRARNTSFTSGTVLLYMGT